MRTVIWRGILARKLRATLTALSILLGVAMVAGTFIITDQIESTFDEIFATSYEGIDVVVSPKEAFDANFSELEPLDQGLVDTVRRVDGVAVAEGQIEGLGSLVIDGEFVKTQGAPTLVFSHLPDPLAAGDYSRGRAPEARGEVGIDFALADREDLAVGDKVGLATRAGVQPVTVSGIFEFGDAESLGGATVVVPTLPDAQTWFDREGKVSSVLVAADEGVTPSELADRIQAVLPTGVEARTGQQTAESDAADISDQINSFLGPALLAFAGVAILVGAFIIFNTFSITVAQRLREIGMLRTIGATRRQVMISVIGEALVIGVVASLLGIAAGIGVSRLILLGFDAAGLGIPVSGVELAPRTVAIALAVGILVSLLATIVPAVRATRVAPVAAMREGAALPPSRFARWAPVVAGLFTVGGLVLLIQGLVGEGGATQRLGGMAAGAVLIFIAVGMVAKYVVPSLARAIGWPLERVAPGVGRIARENAVRNPSRTAVTASALMIGVGLVVFVAVFAAGLKESIFGAVDRSFRGDIVVTGVNFFPFPAGAAEAVSSTPGVEVASGVRFDEAKIGTGGAKSIYGVDPETLPDVFAIEWEAGGSDALYGQLGEGNALIERKAAQDRNLDVGDSFEATSPSGRTARFTIIGRYDDPTFASNGFIVSNDGFARLFTGTDLGFISAKVAEGADKGGVQDRVEAVLKEQYPATEVRSNAEYKQEVENQVNTLLYLLYALLTMSVIISIFGIVNTLVLSITERTREIGMLRAIGVTRSQMRRIVRYESVITSVIGAVLGLAVGILFAFIMTQGLKDEGISFALPEIQLVVFLVLSVIVGILAAVLPARRAARLKVLEAIHHE